jgi:hypothetical protein
MMEVRRSQAGKNILCPFCLFTVAVPRSLLRRSRPTRSKSPGCRAGRRSGSNDPSPAVVAFLNLFCWGAGYLRLGKSWGWSLVLLQFFLCLHMISGDREQFVHYVPLILVAGLLLAWNGYVMACTQK